MNGYILFRKTTNVRVEYDLLNKNVTLNEEEKERLQELRRYASGKVDGWIFDSKVLSFIGGLLTHSSLPDEARVRIVRILALCALRPDFHTLLGLDRRDRYFMNYADRFQTLNVEEQKAVALFFCNLFSSNEGRDWLLYSSEWTNDDDEDDHEESTRKGKKCNVKIASDVAAFSLISYTPSLQDFGSALLHNLALSEVKGISITSETPEGDESEKMEYSSVSDSNLRGLANGTTRVITSMVYKLSATSLCYSILKYLNRNQNLKEEIVYRCLKALEKFTLVIPDEIREGSVLIPIDLCVIANLSERIGSLCKSLQGKV